MPKDISTIRQTSPRAHTFLHFRSVSCGLEVRHRSLVDDIRESCSLKVLLPWLLARVPLPGVLFKGLQTVLLVAKGVGIRIKEVVRLFSHIHHILRRHSIMADQRHERGVTIGRTHPSISTILVIWLYSLVPGNRGSPRNNSTAMQPNDHMSMEALYGIPSSTSGDR